MIPLMPFLVDTMIPMDGPYLDNIVHEWGVVVFQESGAHMAGGLGDGMSFYDQSDIDACAEAPVVWIHGEPFTGAFTVNLPEGQNFTFLYPEPWDSSDLQATWRIEADGSSGHMNEELVPVFGPFQAASVWWEAVPSLDLFFIDAGITANYIYYECTVGSDFCDPFLEWNSGGSPSLREGFPEEALYFIEGRAMTFSPPARGLIDWSFSGEGLTEDQIQEILCGWAGGMLKSSEIEALWETWKPYWQQGSWVVFPIPEEHHLDISRITLSIDRTRTVEYERLFLGAVRLDPR